MVLVLLSAAALSPSAAGYPTLSRVGRISGLPHPIETRPGRRPPSGARLARTISHSTPPDLGHGHGAGSPTTRLTIITRPPLRSFTLSPTLTSIAAAPFVPPIWYRCSKRDARLILPLRSEQGCKPAACGRRPAWTDVPYAGRQAIGGRALRQPGRAQPPPPASPSPGGLASATGLGHAGAGGARLFRCRPPYARSAGPQVRRRPACARRLGALSRAPPASLSP